MTPRLGRRAHAADFRPALGSAYIAGMPPRSPHRPDRPADAPAADAVRRDICARILQADPARVRAIYLYGSRVRGTARPTSDWDIAVVLEGPVDDWVEDSRRIAALFNRRPYGVDVQVVSADEFAATSHIPSTLPYIVARSGERLYDAADRRRIRGTRSRVG